MSKTFHHRNSIFLALIAFWSCLLIALGARVPGQEKVDFAKDIQPIFEASCYRCHGAQQQMAELRFDSKQIAFKEGTTGPVIVPGNARESLLYGRVTGTGPGAQMPFEGEKLTAEQLELIRAWIDQGARWPDDVDVEVAEQKKHWAYEKPVRPEPPRVRNPSWVRNPIDKFILARLEAEGLDPSPGASRETLIRRVSLDLTGLPPPIEEVDAFLADDSLDAYETLVDRLLASPRHGERWARPWLDLARYADTNGYEKDRRGVSGHTGTG